jgi:hypothetical protein
VAGRRLRSLEHFLTFLVVFGIYAGFFHDSTRWPTGDEPHYLLTTISIIEDFDLDLDNQYSQKDWLQFADYNGLDRHCSVVPRGSCLPNHNFWFSLLLAPFYALGGLKAVFLFQFALLAGSCALMSMLLDQLIEPPSLIARMSSVSLGFSSLLASSSIAVYPSLVGAMLVLAGVNLYVLYGKKYDPRTLALSFAPFIALFFFHHAFLFVSLAYVLMVTVLNRNAMRVRVYVAFAIGLFLWGAFPYLLGGNILSGAASSGMNPRGLGNQMAYHLFDSENGLIVHSPLIAIYFVGSLAFWGGHKIDSRQHLTFLAVSNSLIATMLGLYFISSQTPGESPIGRYFVPIVPAMYVIVIFLATRSRWFLAPAIIGGAVSIVVGLAVLVSGCNVASCHAGIEHRIQEWLGLLNPFPLAAIKANFFLTLTAVLGMICNITVPMYRLAKLQWVVSEC